jgi:hypothetical protein
MNVVQIMVRPGDGRRVRMPDGRLLTSDKTPAAGVSVALSTFVRRRLECGDLVEVTPPAPPPSAPPAKSVADMKGA